MSSKFVWNSFCKSVFGIRNRIWIMFYLPINVSEFPSPWLNRTICNRYHAYTSFPKQANHPVNVAFAYIDLHSLLPTEKKCDLYYFWFYFFSFVPLYGAKERKKWIAFCTLSKFASPKRTASNEQNKLIFIWTYIFFFQITLFSDYDEFFILSLYLHLRLILCGVCLCDRERERVHSSRKSCHCICWMCCLHTERQPVKPPLHYIGNTSVSMIVGSAGIVFHHLRPRHFALFQHDQRFYSSQSFQFVISFVSTVWQTWIAVLYDQHFEHWFW